jgi:glycosyltransferase involved in cell wall biosynthesis
MRLTTRLATEITVCSHYQARLATAHGCAPRTIPLGVDGASFVPADRSEGPPWRLLHVASQNPVKDQATLLHAFQLLIQSGVDAHLDVVGEDTMAGAVSRLAEQLGIGSRVCFVGFKASADLIPIYQRSHVFVLSSRHEAAAAVVLEAAASGLPVVGTAVGYIADWAPERSVAVAPRNPAALAAAISELLQNRDRRETLARAARQWTLAHDADWTGREFDHLYAALTTPGS